MKNLPPKEEKKDISGFGGKKFISREEFRQFLKRSDLYLRTGIPESKRLEFEKGIGSKYGNYLERGEPEKLIRELERGQMKPPAGLSKEEAIKLLKEFLGKK